ncbi:hypothetical protein FB451DRAFT_1188248 [Mycena latifolia]|nr:hypothetical protein FB451DRAFT_1188248 [Mycena latifolia]
MTSGTKGLSGVQCAGVAQIEKASMRKESARTKKEQTTRPRVGMKQQKAIITLMRRKGCHESSKEKDGWRKEAMEGGQAKQDLPWTPCRIGACPTPMVTLHVRGRWQEEKKEDGEQGKGTAQDENTA